MRTVPLEKSALEGDFLTLLERSQAGDHAAFGQLWELYLADYLSKTATRELRRRTQSRVRASDIVSDATMRVWEHVRDFRGRTLGELMGWARTTLLRELGRTVVDDGRRKEKLSIDRPASGDAGEEVLDLEDMKVRSPSSVVSNAEEVERLKRDVSKLEWRLLILWKENRSWKDVAEILDSEFGDCREPDAWRMYAKRLIIEETKKRGACDGH